MIKLPEILAFKLTNFVTLSIETLNIQTIVEHMKDAFHYENIDNKILALNFVK